MPLVRAALFVLWACQSLPVLAVDPAPVPRKEHKPLAAFARFISGEWMQPSASGTKMYHTWSWGPGEQSIRCMTTGTDASGNPWRAAAIYYWHPGRKQVCLLALTPYSQGVAEGTMTFAKDSAEAQYELYQTGGRRKLTEQWSLEDPDNYQVKLLETVGDDQTVELATWDFNRIAARKDVVLDPLADVKPAMHLQPLMPLVAPTWGADYHVPISSTIQFRTTLQRIPLVELMEARVVSSQEKYKFRPIFDAYFFRHTGTGKLRCLVLSEQITIEGDVSTLAEGTMRAELKGDGPYDPVHIVMQIDPEQKGEVLHQIWWKTPNDEGSSGDFRHRRIDQVNQK